VLDVVRSGLPNVTVTKQPDGTLDCRFGLTDLGIGHTNGCMTFMTGGGEDDMVVVIGICERLDLTALRRRLHHAGVRRRRCRSLAGASGPGRPARYPEATRMQRWNVPLSAGPGLTKR
jgi:hypothetical protein